MKIKLISLIAIAGISSFLVYQNTQSNNNITISKYSPRVAKKSSKVQDAKGGAEYLASVRGDIKTGIIDPVLLKKAHDFTTNNGSRASAIGLEFELMGPTNIGGRTRGIVVDNEDSKKIYAASVSGGVFISTNSGNTWTRSWLTKAGITIATNVVSCLTQTTDGALYAGLASRFEGGGITGVYKSTDRGASWALLASTELPSTGPNYFNQVNHIIAHPTKANVVAAATGNGGLQVSLDGGTTWNKKIACNGAGLGVSNCITLDWSSDGFELYAGFNGGLFYSGDYTTDCGLTGRGLVGPSRGRWVLAASPNNSLTVYAALSNGGGGYGDIKVTYDGGVNWASLNPPMPISAPNFQLFGDNGGGQAEHDFLFAAVPNLNDPGKDKLFIGGVQLWRYDGNWTQATGGRGQFSMHVDHHVVAYDKKDPNKIYFGNDGGVYTSLDGGITFFDINKDFSTTQYYGIHHANFDFAIGGTQDNGNPYVTPFRPGNTTYGTNTYNQGVLNGDGFDAAVSQIVDLKYTSSQYGNMGRGKIVSQQGSGACQPYCGMGAFRTRLKLWENANDLTSKDSIIFKVDTTQVNVGIGSGSRTTFEGTVIADQSAAIIIPGSIKIGTNGDQLVYDGAGGFTGNGNGTLDEKTLKFSVTFNDAPALNARINSYFTANYPAGSLIIVPSNSEDLPITYVANVNLNPGDVIKIQDPVQSLIALQVNQRCELNSSGTQYICDDPCYSINNRGPAPNCGTANPGAKQPGVAISRRGIALGQNPEWMHLRIGNVGVFEFSKNGNEFLYSPRNSASVRMLQDLNNMYSQKDADNLAPSKSIFNGNGSVQSINYNPKNQNQMLITTGNYGSVNHVFLLNRTPNTDVFNKTVVQGNLPDMPVYDAIFDANKPKRVIIGTDQGIFSTSDITATPVEWIAENFPKIPVFDIDQQILDHSKASNFGMIYVGTYGAGIWKSGTITGIDEISHKDFGNGWESNITVYPNPLQNSGQLKLTVANPAEAFIQIYSINGQIQKTIKPGLVEGENDIAFDVSDLQSGTYFITLLDGNTQKVAKFIKM